MIRPYLLYICLLCLPAAVFGQANVAPPKLTPPAAPADHRMTLDLVVNDSSGNPVAGLPQQDFTVLDNNQPQQILSFEALGQTAANQQTQIVLVVDSVNTAFSRVAFERDQIQKFLQRDNGKLAHPVSIDFFSDSGLDVQPAPSQDGNAQVAYLNQHETALRSIRRSAGFYGAAERMDYSLQAVGRLADYEMQRPGRKLVIWISPGWPLLSGPNVQLTSKQEQDIFNAIVAISAKLRESRITIYAVDPLGTSDAGGFRTFYYEQFVKGVRKPAQAQFGNLALQVLAVQSGGRVLNSSNDVTGEIARCARDANGYYVLSYEMPAADGPNDYHTIQVKISQPQLKAQTRQGYYDQPVRPRTP